MREIGSEIYQLDSGNPGPSVLVIGGIHGNESSGILAIKALLREFTDRPELLIAGRLTVALGNLEAIKLSQRGSQPHADMNRVFSDEILQDMTRNDYEVQRARVLAPLIAAADITIDLHATNKPSDPMVIYPTDSPKLRELAKSFTAERVLTDPTHIIPNATDIYAEQHGHIGICYESGWINDADATGKITTAVQRLLELQKMVKPSDLDLATQHQTIYEITEPIILTEAGFNWETPLGERSFDHFNIGDTIGYHGPTPLIAAYAGVIVFPKVKELQKIGSPIGFLAKVIS